MSEIDQAISFRQLLETCHHIEVPLIQRDYAQGRASEGEVRDHFLKALHEALVRSVEGHGPPLNLDFVYGSKEGGKSVKFLPLDGQQRLTTLFLLHWYLGWRDARLADVQDMLCDGDRSRFTYRVRPSSTEFFDELVRFAPFDGPDAVQSIRALVENQPWFYLHWRLDPTIQSALVMLDAIHSLFQSSTGLYERLIDNKHPAITFQLLPLEHFGLSDDLYIKMNARGKPLTPFETFKARFEEHLGELFPTEFRRFEEADVSIANFFENRVDTRWTDFFWSYKNPKTNTFDAAIMNLIVAVIRVSLDSDPASSKFSDDTTLLRTKGREWTFSFLHERGWLSRTFVHNLIVVLEAWSVNHGKLAPVLPSSRYFDESDFFNQACRDPAAIDYLLMVQFGALAFHLREHEGTVEAESAGEWMRVVRNLAINSDIERPEQFGRSLAGLSRLVPSSANVLEQLATAEIGQIGFSPLQVAEEVLKAKLLLADPGWRQLVDKAEEHEYFGGQIGFLFAFSGVIGQSQAQPISDWDHQVHADLQEKFAKYLRYSQVMFNRAGLWEIGASGTHLWKRALLATGDYMARIGSNRSFLTDPARNPDSWKRFLRDGDGRQHLKTLWDQIDVDRDIASQLSEIISSASVPEAWRASMIKYPQVISYCGQQEIRWPFGSQEIYLLSKRQMNGSHAELFSYVLYHDLADLDIAPLEREFYESVTSSDTQPCAHVAFKRGGYRMRFSILSSLGTFRIFVNRAELQSMPEVESCLRDQDEFVEQDTWMVRDVSRDQVLDALKQAARNLSQLPA